MFHLPFIRQLSFVVFIVIGLVLQAQSVWACQLMDGTSSIMCCCDDAKSEGCSNGGDSDKSSNTEVSAGKSCCDVSAQQINAVTSHQTTPNSQMVLLNAPQPPSPIPSLDSTSAAQIFHFEHFPALSAHTQLYQLTQRIRL